ncbi:MAG: tetratricopeptide (TPR) repeat protein [Halioglobus sp.]|jgi:tetratricopeptide (TPR) repeat protein
MLRLLLSIAVLTLFVGCASTDTVESPAPLVEPEAAVVVIAAEPEEKVEVEIPERPFPPDSLYPLLVAEFALRRDSYEVALKNYRDQARILDDPGVHAHTTHLAQFMRDEESVLEAASLWVRSEPDNVEVNSILADLLTRKGRVVEALPHLAVVGRSGGKAQYPMLLNGFRALSTQDKMKLVEGIDELAQEFPTDVQILLTQALIQGELGRAEQALDKLNAIFDQEPYQDQAVLLETKLLVESGADEPFARLQTALELKPEDKRLRLQYARLLTRSDLDEAQKQFEILSAQSPRDGDILFSLALLNRETGESDKAKAYLREMLSLGQRINEGQYYLGRIAEEGGELEEALSHYGKVKSGGDFFSANSRIGNILIGSKQPDRMSDYFAELRQDKKEFAAQLYSLEVDLLAKADETDAALALANTSLLEFPNSTALLYTRSMLGEKQDNLALMESDLRSIIALEPNNATALNALGYSLANRTQRFEEAHFLISKALKLQPQEPAILDSMGWVLYRQGNYEEAIEFLTKAYTGYPDPEVAAHLGEVLWITGRTSQAKDVWRGALIKDPQHEILTSTLKRLGIKDLEVTR